MKNRFLIIAIFLLSISCKKKSDGFLITGHISNYNNDYLYLDIGNGIADSCFVTNNHFSFEGKLIQPVSATFYTTAVSSASNRNLYLENNEVSVNLSLTKRTSGSGLELDWITIEDVKGSKLDSHYMEYQILKEKKIDRRNRVLYNKLSEIIITDPTNILSAHLLDDGILEGDFTQKQLIQLYNMIDWANIDSFFHKKVRLKIFEEEKVEKGHEIIDFELPDEKEEIVASTNFRGKIVLLDFWASWCAPCREEFPELRDIYGEYNNRGFEILGISIDNSPNDWKKALAKDSITWTNVIAPGGFKSQLALDYNVFAIPKNYLVDNNGVIIAKDLTTEELSIWLKSNIDEINK